MGDTLFYDTLRHGLWVAAMVSMPILSVALITGLVVGLFQALTSIQEMTLTFVPKLAAIIGTFWITMNYMSESLVSLFKGTLVPLIAGG